MPDLFGLRTDLIKDDVFFCVSAAAFVHSFFSLLFLATGSTPAASPRF
jgi:hypothetical protein